MPSAVVAGNRPRQKSQRQRHRSRTHLAGTIFWLPKKEDLGNAGATADDDFEEGYYQHPVVILSAKAREGNVDVLIVRLLPPPPQSLYSCL